MQFVVENEAFAKALALVKGCVPTHSTVPILAHVAVEAKDGVVVVRATNLERETEVSVPAEVTEAGGAALPGEVLSALARRLTKGGQSKVVLADDRVKIVSGTASYDLRTLPIGDFPSRKEISGEATTFSMAADDLRDLFAMTSFALLAKSSRAYHQGAYLHVLQRKLIVTATDDHRLAVKSMDMPAGAAAMPGVIIPADAVRDLVSFLDGEEAAELSVSKSLFELRLPKVRFSTLLVDATYPEYQGFIPKTNGAGAIVRPYALAEAVNRATVVYLGDRDTNRRVPVVDLEAKDGALLLNAGVQGNELGAESIEAETNGHALHFSVNATYLSEMLNVWPESVAISVQQENASAPILFRADDRPDMQHVIMPTRR